MAESICRILRDGALEGEHAPALTIKDSISSPYGLDVFTYILTQLSLNILAGKSQSRGLVLVAFSRSPSFYVDLLKRRGVNLTSSDKWIQILDCYTDPLGWKDWLEKDLEKMNISSRAAPRVCKDIMNLDKLFGSIIELGIGSIDHVKRHFSVAIDSVDEMLRHTSKQQVSRLLSNLRSHDQVSSTIWLLHSDLNEVGASTVLEYMSSIVATLQPYNLLEDGQRQDTQNLSMLEQNLRKGKFNARFKRRNGRVRVTCEEFHVDQSGIKFTSTSSEDAIINQSLLPKVQFNLQLSEEERLERSKVVLPFEHQGNGKPIQIYDGRRSLSGNNNETASDAFSNENSNKGEILYFRDSDDEMPDSDEDPDDDLDI